MTGYFLFHFSALVLRVHIFLLNAYKVFLNSSFVAFAENRRVLDPDQYSVLVGTNDRDEGGFLHPISTRIAHDRYIREERNYDIGLLKTLTRMKFSEQLQPIALPQDNPLFNPTLPVVAVGWGWTKVSYYSKIWKDYFTLIRFT